MFPLLMGLASQRVGKNACLKWELRLLAADKLWGKLMVIARLPSTPQLLQNLTSIQMARSLENQDPKLSGVIASTNDSSIGAQKKTRDVNGLASVNEDTSSSMVEETSLKWSPAAQ
ncbi:hypothetical protein RHSIM_Rhsim03G0095800 [Rhododendron simsii]|uniref:Uncharacterized protein n=1 Tax=Rhododendron simsii TaxID=118357 RepID=A0A834LTG3_RHOSS|nr:hypothetical protein RHSIM_Rhsim03G0095800 [Rhododendron simsii]